MTRNHCQRRHGKRRPEAPSSQDRFCLAAVIGGKTGAGNFVGVDHEADQRRHAASGQIELSHLEGVQGELVTVWFITLRRTGTAKARLTKIGLALYCTDRQTLALGADLRGQGLHISRNVEYHPVPPAATRRGIGIIDGQRVTLGSCRGSLGAVPFTCC